MIRTYRSPRETDCEIFIKAVLRDSFFTLIFQPIMLYCIWLILNIFFYFLGVFMINEEKVKLMTRIQLFQDDEKEVIRSRKYYQSDYLKIFLFRSFIAYLILFVLVLAFVILYNGETLANELSLDMVIRTTKNVLISFVVLLFFVMIVSYIVYWFRFRRLQKKLKVYVSNLQKLDDIYRQEEEMESSRLRDTYNDDYVTAAAGKGGIN